MSSHRDKDALVEQSSVGAHPAIDPSVWVDQYGDYLFRYAFSRLRDANAAEEVVQETFLAGIRFQHQFTGQGSERGWLLGILKRKIVDYVRKRTRHDRTSSYQDENDPILELFDGTGNRRRDELPWSRTPDRVVESKELWDVVHKCLKHVPAGQADVFVLSVMEDLDTEEICKELGITPNNLWVRLHRARLMLAKCVGARWFASEEPDDDAQ